MQLLLFLFLQNFKKIQEERRRREGEIKGQTIGMDRRERRS